MADPVKFHAIAYNSAGEAAKELMIVDEHDDGPEFFAHQILHQDDITCVQIFPVVDLQPGGAGFDPPAALLTRCDPGVEFPS